MNDCSIPYTTPCDAIYAMLYYTVQPDRNQELNRTVKSNQMLCALTRDIILASSDIR